MAVAAVAPCASFARLSISCRENTAVSPAGRPNSPSVMAPLGSTGFLSTPLPISVARPAGCRVATRRVVIRGMAEKAVINELRSSRQSSACSTAKRVQEWSSQSYGSGSRREPVKRSVVRYAASSESKVGFFGKLGRVIKEKAKGDIDRLFNGFSKTRENLSVVDELLTYWNLPDSENTLDELEEALLVADFGPRTALKIVDEIRKDILAGKLTTGGQIKTALKASILKLLTQKISNTDLQLGTSRPAVIMVVGVNGGGKTTSIGKLAHRLKKVEDIKVLMAAGDTFRAAAREQLEIWAQRTNSDIEMGEGDKKRPAAVLAQATKRALEEGYDILLADTSGRLHNNLNLMDELRNCKRAITKVLPGAPNEVLMVLDGTTGLNMLPQAREFNQVAGVTGFIVTKLDGTSRGGCVVSVVDELEIPVKFIGVGEKLDDLQPFDAEGFVNALFP